MHQPTEEDNFKVFKAMRGAHMDQPKEDNVKDEFIDEYQPPFVLPRKHSADLDQIAAALSNAQGEMHGATKDKDNPYFNSKYADLASVFDAFRQPFAKHGLSLFQSASSTINSVTIYSMLLHKSGQYLSDSLTLYPSKVVKDKEGNYVEATKFDPQTLGSAVTYGRRYLAQAMAGVCPEDDDGNLASNTEGQGKKVEKVMRTVKSPPPLAAHIAQPLEWHECSITAYTQPTGENKPHRITFNVNGADMAASNFHLPEGWTPDIVEAMKQSGERIMMMYEYDKSGRYMNFIGLNTIEESENME